MCFKHGGSIGWILVERQGRAEGKKAKRICEPLGFLTTWIPYHLHKSPLSGIDEDSHSSENKYVGKGQPYFAV